MQGIVCEWLNFATMKRIIVVLLSTVVSMAVNAKLVVTQTSCNHQKGRVAIVEDRVRVGWQYFDSGNWPIIQDCYQIEVRERVTGQLVYDSGVVYSGESQLIELPYLSYNVFGYTWRVRIGYQGGKGKDERLNHWSGWSSEQIIRVVPSDLSKIPAQAHSSAQKPQWVGAISKSDAHIPDGRWSNEVFKRDTFKTRWENVDTLSSRSIILRKAFRTTHHIEDAVVYVCGLGHYEMNINGRRVGNSEFAPLWSEYSRTVYYNTYDVTDLLCDGDNAVNVLLGNGFFNVQRGSRYSKLQASFGPPQLFLRMDITYDDGTIDHVVSDGSWHWTLSPITFNSIYGGESYDARMEQEGCLDPRYDDSKWNQAVVVEGPGGRLRPETAPPVRIMEYYNVQTINHIAPDSIDAASQSTKRTVSPSTFVCDMGQNLAGYPEIIVSGKRGQKVTLLVSERLTPQGACDQRQTGRQHYYEYTLKGDGEETWHPRFSYYGFRYIQVEGAVMEKQPNPDGLPVIHNLRSCFIYNSAPETSSFWCDNERMTKTHRLIERAERSNMQAVLTDCPHREKLGWLEQDHLCGPSLLYNYDMTTLVPKIIRDIADTQKPDGMVPTTAPQYVSFGNLFDDSPEWGSTLVILPFMYYDMYGDSTLITDYYEPMRRYVDYLTSRADGGIVSHGLGDWYDYGPRKPGFTQNTPVPLVATAHYIYDLQLITEAARMTGHDADRTRYQKLYEETVDAFNRHFYHPDSCYYGTGSQTSNALPLFLGITGEHKAAVLQNLIDDIHAHGDRLTTGDVGNRYLFRVLADNGQNELLFRMLNHDDVPGYGFQLAQGATTLTEQWDPRQGSSENHFMLGQIDEWFFRTLAGIRQKPGTHGMRSLIIDPVPIEGIGRVRASIHTVYGEVMVDFDPSANTLYTQIPYGCQLERPSFSEPKEQLAGNGLFLLAAVPTLSVRNIYYDNRLSERYDPQLPWIWYGPTQLSDGIMGSSNNDAYHLRHGTFRKTEYGFTFLQISRNLYRGIFGYSVALQMVGYNYQIDPWLLAKKEGHSVAFEPTDVRLKDNDLSFFGVRIPFLMGVQTYGRQLSLQTGVGLYVGGSDYEFCLPNEKRSEKRHLHTRNFGAQWLVTAGIGPITFSYTQNLVPLFKLTDGTEAYPSSFTLGIDLGYWIRRHFRPKK